MRVLIFLLSTLFYLNVNAQVSIVSWNIADFGRTKNEQEIKQIAQIIRDFDIIAIQEVVAVDPAGAQAVARLADQLNRMGARWDYRVSDPTDSPGRGRKERYAFIWKTGKAHLEGRPWLDKHFEPVVYREPYLARFRVAGGVIMLVNYHSRSHNDNPQVEIDCLQYFPNLYPKDNLIFAGDFNTFTKDEVFQPLYNMGFQPSPSNQKTTLKRKCGKKGAYLNHPIDFILYNENELTLLDEGHEDFIRDCNRLTEARMLSDHLPVWVKVKLK